MSEPISRRGFMTVAAATTAATAAAQAPRPVLNTVQPQVSARPAPAAVRVVTSERLDATEVQDLKAHSPGIDVVVCASRDDVYAQIETADVFYGAIDRRALQLAKRLQWIQHPAAGVEGIMRIPELVSSPVVLTNMQRVFAPVISETAIGMLLALARGIPTYVRQADQRVWKVAPNLVEISDKTMGVIGFGGLGGETARRAHYGFNMRVIAVDAKPLPKPHWVAELHDPGWQDELLKQSDAVVVAAPETDQTREMVNEQFLRKMKPSAYILMISRGTLYKGADMLRALKEGWIAGAGLDVTPREPLPADDPLWTAPNAIITCHTSGHAPERRGRQVGLFSENLRRYVNGLPLMNVVDKSRGY